MIRITDKKQKRQKLKRPYQNNGLKGSQNYGETSYMKETKKKKKKIMRKKYTSVVKTTLTRQATFTKLHSLHFKI